MSCSGNLKALLIRPSLLGIGKQNGEDLFLKRNMSKLPYLNLGCGTKFHPDWTNLDFESVGDAVQAHNLLNGIPFDDESFEVVYHSHVLEHFPKKKAPEFLKECYRVLKRGGTIRIAIPNLEVIVLNYLKYLNESLENKPGAAAKYEWTMLELYDQVVRTEPGGDMVAYISDSGKNNDRFLLERNGKEVQDIMEYLRNPRPKVDAPPAKPSFMSKIKWAIRDRLTRKLLREDYDLLKQSKFRTHGEIHQWMYDRYSLCVLLESVGFTNVTVTSAFESRIPGWNAFELDGSNNMIRKPDSLFMEAVK